MEGSSKKQIILWSSVAAAAAGIIAVAAIFALRSRKGAADSITSRIRDVQDVILDCERKIHEIEARIPGIVSIPHST